MYYLWRVVMASSAKKEPVELFRDFDVYSLTIDQHAALVSALNHALDRIADSNDRIKKEEEKEGQKKKQKKENNPGTYENIMERTIFRERYTRLLYKAWRTVRLEDEKATTHNTQQVTCNFIEDDEVKWEKAVKYLQDYVKIVRGYFTHYVHTGTDLKELGEDKVFKTFLKLLERETHEAWLKEHIAWINTPEQADEKLYAEVTDFSWPEWRKTLAIYEKDIKTTPVSMCSLLLFISIFAAKDVMHKLLNKLHKIKQYDTDNPKEVLQKAAAREIFTVLSLPARFDAQSSVDKNIIAAWTILDNFAHRLGKRTHYKKHTGQISQVALVDDCMSTSFNQHFYIRMLVNIIEASNILPGISIARAYDGCPRFELAEPEQREIYIRHNAVAISWKLADDEKYYGQLSMNALVAILCAWLKKNEAIKLVGGKFDPLTMVAQALQETNYPKSIDASICQAFPEFFTQEMQTEALPEVRTKEQESKDSKALLSRIESLEARYFADKRSPHKQAIADNMPPHRKAIAVLWWINRLLPDGNKIHKEAYRDALIYATNNDIEALYECLPKLNDVPDSEKNVLTKLYSAIKSTKSISKAFLESKKSFEAYLTTVFITNQNPYKVQKNATPKKVERLAKLVGLRRMKPRGKSQEEAWKKFQTRFKNAATLPAWSIWKLLRLPRYEPKKEGSQGNIPLSKFIAEELEGATSEFVDRILPENYYKRSAFKIRNCDRLLLHLTKRLLENCGATKEGQMSLHLNEADFTYEVRHVIGDFTLILPHTQARRTYVSRHPDRLKNVIDHYWTDKNVKEIPFAWQPETPEQPKPERADNSPPRDFLEAESDMEQERFIMIKAVLMWERDIAKRHIADPENACLQAKSVTHLDFHEILAEGGHNDAASKDCIEFRNWALHQSPKKPFSQAPGELGKRFSTIKENMKIRKKEKKRSGQQAFFKKRP